MMNAAATLAELVRRLGAPSDPRRLWIRYALGLSLVFVSISVSHIAWMMTVQKVEQRAELIAESVSQRERIKRTLSFSTMAQTLQTKAALDQLTVLIDELVDVHDRILDETADKIPEVADIYKTGRQGPALDPIFRRFVSDARLVASLDVSAEERDDALTRMHSVGVAVIPVVLQEITTHLEVDVHSHSTEMRLIVDTTFWLALAILAGEALFIFWPAHIAVRKALDGLEEAKGDVEARNVDLEILRRSAEHDAHHDALTGLPNRRGFERAMGRLAERVRQNDSGLAVLHIDLDRFKEINDRLGHPAGDHVLRYVAGVLTDVVDPGDVVARVGGDEFVIVKESSGDRRRLEAIAARAIEQLSNPIHFKGELCQFGASIGIDVGIACQSGVDLDCERLVANADIALYQAKESGRGRFQFFSESLRDAVERQRALADELALALRRDELAPFYQPQFDARTGRIVGVEALVRWRHPIQGLISPGVFLPVAEQLGVMHKIDRLVLEKALRDVARSETMGAPIPRLSVNVSSTWLRDRELVATLHALKPRPGLLAIEILETAFTDEIDDQLRYTLDAFADIGIDIEIDDFGTGRASLVSLLSLKPTRLKLARELIAPLPDSENHVGLVKSVLDIATSLDIAVTAEGIETEAQCQMLTSMGCDRFQGFYFAKPMPADDLAKLLVAERDGDDASTLSVRAGG